MRCRESSTNVVAKLVTNLRDETMTTTPNQYSADKLNDRITLVNALTNAIKAYTNESFDAPLDEIMARHYTNAMTVTILSPADYDRVFIDQLDHELRCAHDEAIDEAADRLGVNLAGSIVALGPVAWTTLVEYLQAHVNWRGMLAPVIWAQ